MQNRIHTLLAIIFLSLAGLVSPAGTLCAADAFYVAPDGDDANAGTPGQPFATIQRAQTAVRQKTEVGLTDDVVVYLRGGVYRLDDTLRFGPLDAGTAAHSVTYTTAEGEEVVISGGREISDWKQTDNGLWSADIPDVKSEKWFFRQLYVDGGRAPRGRYPKEGYLKIKNVSADYKKLQLNEALPAEDFGGQDAEVVVVQNWSISRALIAGSAADEVTSETPIGWVGHSHCLPKRGMSVFLENSLSLITEPGQWYLERKTGTLFFKAADGQDPNALCFVAPMVKQLVDIEGDATQTVLNLHFKNIGFEHSAWLIPEIGYGGIQACYHGTTLEEATCYAVDVAVEMDYCRSCSIQRCHVTRIGGSGIGVGAGCQDNRIVGCEINDIGASGVNVGHMKVKDPLWADWSTPDDAPANNEVANCYIHHCGEDLWGAHGIFDAMTRDTKVRHNEVAFIPYGGIATGYVWGTERTSQQGCVIEYNHIHEVTLKLNDSGCLYTLGFQPGSIIRGNLLHGVRFGGFAGGQICNNGIFFDEGSKGFLLEDNVIYDVDQAPGARNTAVRFNRSSEEWQIWINNTIQTDAAPPEAAEALTEQAGLEAEYRDLLKSGN